MHVPASDGVLVEYVLVLLANNNSLNRVYEELGVFMGAEAAQTFVQWLSVEINSLMGAPVPVPVPAPVPEAAALPPTLPPMPLPQTLPPTLPTDDVHMARTRPQISRTFTKALSTALASAPGDTRRSPRTSASRAPRTSPSPGTRRVVKATDASRPGPRQRLRLEVNFDADDRSRGHASSTSTSPSTARHRHPPRAAPPSDSPAPQKAPVRCPFWPNCRDSDDACPNIHPSEACKNFPNCPYAASCTFIHPVVPCRYQARCQNPLCNYQHTAPPLLPPTAPSAGTSTVLCRFYPHCANPLCAFLHPIAAPCKFGPNCHRPDCPYEHPPLAHKSLKSVVYAPCKYGLQCARIDCPYQHPPKQDGAAADSAPAGADAAAAAPVTPLPEPMNTN